MGFEGVIAIDIRPAGLTVRVAVPFKEPDVIPMVVVPVPSVLASPAVLLALLIVATVASLELQCPVWVRS